MAHGYCPRALAVAFGRTDKLIARDLFLSPRTVEMHVAGSMRPLGATTGAEAVHKAIRSTATCRALSATRSGPYGLCGIQPK
ncbi:LuxR C-terminal-related transcriptional regulator [Cupriavidus pinatubonensis]|uniref:LuxR C-terminal-related transcriptional regulator n=1 Tax=Cupriavidus pinatubonensis TaxID=248026 RepID=UPI001CC455AF|nr:LuxR C-terminal-related transcriptional regulator [Cupriavidus pinatubonensis]